MARRLARILTCKGSAWSLPRSESSSYLRESRQTKALVDLFAHYLSEKVLLQISKAPSPFFSIKLKKFLSPIPVGTPITFDASESISMIGEKKIVSWEWDVDADGVFENFGPVIKDFFYETGLRTVRLRVKDDSFPKNSDTFEFLVESTL